MDIFKQLGEYFNPANTQPSIRPVAPVDPQAIKCISCGEPSHCEYNVCANCWDEVPKADKKRFTNIKAD